MAAPLKVRVEKASSRVLVSVPAKDRHSKRQVAVVHIRSHGAAAGGHVRVQVGSRKAMASVRNGVARVRLPKSRMGNKRIRVVYSGDRNHSAARRAVPVNVG